MGLDVASSLLFWERSQPGEEPRRRRIRAVAENWFPQLSSARVKYVLAELEKRFPEPSLEALRRWRPEAESQAPLVCHWHLQASDPLYREFTSRYLVEAWAQPDGVTVPAVTDWLEQRGAQADWSPSTRRRLASGLMAAATEAGFLKGSGRVREPKAVTADATSLLYLRRTLLVDQDRPELAEVLLLSGTVV